MYPGGLGGHSDSGSYILMILCLVEKFIFSSSDGGEFCLWRKGLNMSLTDRAQVARWHSISYG